MSTYDEKASTSSCKVVTEIDRSQRQLTDMPVISIPESRAIRSLHLQRNRITRLPDSIAMFTQLRYLDISNNGMISLSPEICQLRDLQTLIARNNQLTDGKYI